MSEFTRFNSLISTTVLLMQYIVENLLLQMYVYNCKLTEFFLLKITGIGCMNTVLLSIAF